MPKPRTQFVFLDPCGCPVGVTEGDPIEGAWRFYTAAEKRAMVKRGVTVVHVSHDEYVARYYPQMTARCPHTAPLAAEEPTHAHV